MQDNPVYINTQHPNSDLSQPTKTQELQDTTKTQWIAIHNLQIIGMYGTQADAVDGLNGYRMKSVIDLNDVLGVYQIV